MTLRIHYREQGAGPPLVLLHSAGMGASQWRGVADRLADRRRLLMPNLRGYGRTPPPDPAAPPLGEEVAVVREMAAMAGAPVHLVGHSLGALVALHHALQHPETVAGLTLIEPVIVGILHEDRAGGDETAGRSLDEIGAMIGAFQSAAVAGDTAAAMRAFTEYWEGPGAWDAIPAAARLPFFARAEKMAADVELAWADRTGRDRFAALAGPAQVLSAERTTPAARDMAQRIAGAIPGAIPGARHTEIPEAGHMAPVTHPAAVADLLLDFEERAPGWRGRTS